MLRGLRGLWILAAVLAALVVAGQAGPAKAAVKEEGHGASDSVTADESHSQYLDRIEKEIRELGKHIEELGRQTETAGGKAKSEAKKAVKELDVKKRKLEAEARDLKRSGEKAWQKLRLKVDSALEELKRSVEKVRAKVAPAKGEAL